MAPFPLHAPQSYDTNQLNYMHSIHEEQQQHIADETRMSGAFTMNKSQRAGHVNELGPLKWVLRLDQIPGVLLPIATREIHFDILNAPSEPGLEPSHIKSPTDFNENGLCVRTRKGDYKKRFRSLISDLAKIIPH